MKKTNILYIIAGAVLILSVLCFVGCREQKDDTPSDEGTGGKTIDEILEEAKENGPVAPEGEITEIWFDETFNAYYPKQLKDIIFTRIYMYGELESEQPVICLCSETIEDISIFGISDGEPGEELYTVDSLEPMEAIVLQVELSETADIGISFTDESGNKQSYSLARNADGSEVVTTQISAD